MRAALAALKDDGLVARSTLYETPPWGPVEQPPYLNAIAVVRGDRDAAGWLARAHELEQAAGRTREVRWGARTLDVDVVTVTGDDGTPVLSDDPELTLPHPRAHERAFVLVPWLTLEPGAVLPGHGRVADLVAALPPEDVAAVDALGARGSEGVPMTPVRRRDLVVLAGGLAVASWLLVRSFYGHARAGLVAAVAPGRARRGRGAGGPYPPRAAGGCPGGAVAERQDPPSQPAPALVRPVEPLLVARLAVLAQASAYVGAIFTGIWAGVLAHVGPALGRLQAATGDSVTAVLGVLCAAGLVAAALFLESVCRVPPEDHDPTDGARA